ncbi:g4269 [Coccomyxa viridis]|uniref:G4269 protein n=1 Tax=Coccomyxa viridis TaxID=1274662 RepID=A0ABP1FTW9_9CHLO
MPSGTHQQGGCSINTAAEEPLLDKRDPSRNSSMRAPGPRARTTFVLGIAFILERLDESILGAVYTPLGKALHASPSQLGTLTLCRALVQALFSPFTGILGDKYNRIIIVAVGTFLWGIMTAAIGLSTTLPQAMAWAAFNGVGLAFVLPCAQSILADYYIPEQRGRAFGFMFTLAALGSMAGGFFATSISGKMPAGIEGWRFAFFVIAAIAVAAAVVTLGLGVDPRLTVRSSATSDKRLASIVLEALSAAWTSFRAVLRVRTFQVLVLQGVVGGMPWNAVGYFTMWLQTLGFSDMPAAALTALFWGGTALGNLVGGIVGDLLAKRLPNVGRQLTCQVSIAVGLPLVAILIKALPERGGAAGSMDPLTGGYGVLLFLLGSVISWPQTQNSAMFSEVVPENLRSSIYAFDRCFEGAISALSAPLVGLVAERWFHYTSNFHGSTPQQQLTNATALGDGLLVCLMVPWGLQLLFYSFLYRAFPRDRDMSAELNREGRLQHSNSQTGILATADSNASEPRLRGPGAEGAARLDSR